MRVYNVCGQLVKTILNEKQAPGYYAAAWNGKDTMGRKVASGVYFYRLLARVSRQKDGPPENRRTAPAQTAPPGGQARHDDGGQASNPALPFPRYSGVSVEASEGEVPAPSEIEVFSASKKMLLLR